jgi:hypothetical protein
MDTAQLTDQSSPRNRAPCLLACIACRKKHLKCDAKMPTCKRCQDSGTECSYQQSRRGGKVLKKHSIGSENYGDAIEEESAPTRGPHVNPTTMFPIDTLGDWSSPALPGFNFAVNENAFSMENLLGGASFEPHGAAPESPCQTGTGLEGMSNVGKSLSTNNEQDKELIRSYYNGAANPTAGKHSEARSSGAGGDIDALIDIYFANFNNGHPFLIPRMLHRMKPAFLSPQLKTVMQFVASHFVPGFSQRNLRNEAEIITSDRIPKDGHKVQGLMLFGMSLYARLEQQPALAVVNQAIDLALDLGMNCNSFSLKHGMDNPIIEESWRRTWWDLYMMDGILASLNSVQHPFRLQHVQTDVPLPCEELDYAQCRPMPPPRTQSDFLGRTFAVDTYEYSSMAYKIEAVRLSGNVLTLGKDVLASSDEQVEGVDASLASFILSLSLHKRHIVERDGKVDEVLFSAHNIINCALIMLHRPRSNLVFIRNHYPTPCTRREAIGTPLSAYEIHTSQAVKAANAISNATAMRTALAMHDPCFICAIALAAVVHLPAYSIEANRHRSGVIKERLQLTISALNSIGETWPLAKAVRMQISQFAREISGSHAAATGSSQAGAQIQQIDIDSLMDDQTWLDDVSYLGPN